MLYLPRFCRLSAWRGSTGGNGCRVIAPPRLGAGGHCIIIIITTITAAYRVAALSEQVSEMGPLWLVVLHCWPQCCFVSCVVLRLGVWLQLPPCIRYGAVAVTAQFCAVTCCRAPKAAIAAPWLQGASKHP